ncbi:hypothetical protein PLICRDRAFT_198916 [Plicaturopsis crispa FD-325 SS-3]|nr:hypothetical protein PLICRDRAFT_198916 [Plicaturopsis crispa FD-325 SS-3]
MDTLDTGIPGFLHIHDTPSLGFALLITFCVRCSSLVFDLLSLRSLLPIFRFHSHRIYLLAPSFLILYWLVVTICARRHTIIWILPLAWSHHCICTSCVAFPVASSGLVVMLVYGVAAV